MIPFITRRILPKLRWKKLYGCKNIGSCLSNRKYSSSLPVSFDDIRLQKHLTFLSEMYTRAGGNRNELDANLGFTYEMLSHIVDMVRELKGIEEEMHELDVLISDIKDKKDELYSAAVSEKENFNRKLEALQHKIVECLVPGDVADEKDILLELSAGVGGQEAMLFAKDMFHMYTHFATHMGWRHEVLRYEATDIGGVRVAHVGVEGAGAYRVLKYESGVHRVQRVPRTERAGRMHTSTMTVAVLPQPTEIDIVIKPGDIELEFKRSSGAGGQHVNTTDSCVRIHHKPTGIVTESQQERDQHRNRAIAMRTLRARLYERELERLRAHTTSARRSQVGSGGRSEKVRTYNFAQDRVTDHRAHVTLHGVQELLRGGEHFLRLNTLLREWDTAHSLLHALHKYNST